MTEITTEFDAPKMEAAGSVTPTPPHCSKLLVCEDSSQLRATRCTANWANRQLVTTALDSDRKKECSKQTLAAPERIKAMAKVLSADSEQSQDFLWD